MSSCRNGVHTLFCFPFFLNFTLLSSSPILFYLPLFFSIIRKNSSYLHAPTISHPLIPSFFLFLPSSARRSSILLLFYIFSCLSFNFFKTFLILLLICFFPSLLATLFDLYPFFSFSPRNIHTHTHTLYLINALSFTLVHSHFSTGYHELYVSLDNSSLVSLFY